MAYKVSKERFESLVEAAYAELPRDFANRLENIAIVIEDVPTRYDAEIVGVPVNQLLGLFRGVPYRTGKSFFDIPPALPDEIYIFQRNIEAICNNEADLVAEIRQTLVHEVGHYFGLSEDDLAQYE